MIAFLMEEGPSGDHGDLVVGRTAAKNDESFESLVCHMVGVEPPARITAAELEAVAYVRDMVQANPLAGCQDAISKRHTQLVDLFKAAAVKILGGYER